MLKIISFLGLFFVVLLTGCATTKIPQASGGSRSDGIVEMSYESEWFEMPKVQWDLAQIKAAARCKSWGYQGASRFHGEKRKCLTYDSENVCTNDLITVKYQCLNASS